MAKALEHLLPALVVNVVAVVVRDVRVVNLRDQVGVLDQRVVLGLFAVERAVVIVQNVHRGRVVAVRVHGVAMARVDGDRHLPVGFVHVVVRGQVLNLGIALVIGANGDGLRASRDAKVAEHRRGDADVQRFRRDRVLRG